MSSFRRTLTIGSLLFTGITAAALFYTAQNVQSLEDQLASIERQIEDEQDSLQVLKAEWQYLNRPDRLESLARRHLKLDLLSERQKVSVRYIPKDPDAGILKSKVNYDNQKDDIELIKWNSLAESPYLSQERDAQIMVHQSKNAPTPQHHPRYISVSLEDLWHERN